MTARDPTSRAVTYIQPSDLRVTMPNCIRFVNRETKQAEILNVLDEKICQHLNVEVHPTLWHENWYNIIGLYAAMGRTYSEIRIYLADADDHGLLKVLDYLEQNYDLDAFYTR